MQRPECCLGCSITLLPKKSFCLSDCKKLHFHCNLSFCFHPTLPSFLFLTVGTFSNSVYLCAFKRKKFKDYYTYLMHANMRSLKKLEPLCQTAHQSDIIFLHFTATFSLVIIQIKFFLCKCVFSLHI